MLLVYDNETMSLAINSIISRSYKQDINDGIGGASKLAQKSFASPVKTSSKSNTITENI